MPVKELVKKIVAVQTADGDLEVINETGISALWSRIKRGDVDTIVFGEISLDGTVTWEKQFSEATVMPSSFGK